MTENILSQHRDKMLKCNKCEPGLTVEEEENLNTITNGGDDMLLFFYKTFCEQCQVLCYVVCCVCCALAIFDDRVFIATSKWAFDWRVNYLVRLACI